jgi:hypothetical protein
MGKPHPILLEVAAGREIDPAKVTAAVIDSAVDHRMVGLLASAADSDDVPKESRLRLEALDMSISAYQQGLVGIAAHVHSRLSEAGVDHMFFKGLIEAHRTFPHPSGRPFTDIDLSIAPQASLAAAASALAADHPHLGGLDELVAAGHITAIGIQVNGFPVDLHTEPLRVGPRLQNPQLWWNRTITVDIPGVGAVRALDPEASLVAFLLHQARDRFRYLLGAAEYRLRLDGEIDWAGVRQLAEAEGLWEQVAVSAESLASILGIPSPVEPPRNWRTSTWRRLWAPPVQLPGPQGRLRHNRRGVWLMPLLARGRTTGSLRWIARSLAPPDGALRIRNPHDRGPYLWRLLGARIYRVSGRRLTSLLGSRHRSTR